MPSSEPQSRHDRLLAQAREAFAEHVIRKQSEGRWLLQKRHPNGGWTWIMGVEVISLAHGQLYVGGDIEHVIYAYYGDKPGNHEAKVRWMGRCHDVDYYVAQKACVGTGRSLTEVYDSDAAEETIAHWGAEYRKESETAWPEDVKRNIACAEALEAFLEYPGAGFTHHELLDSLARELGDYWQIIMEERWDVGMVLAPRVYYTHAALRRLCDLLDERQSAVAPENHGYAVG